MSDLLSRVCGFCWHRADLTSWECDGEGLARRSHCCAGCSDRAVGSPARRAGPRYRKPDGADRGVGRADPSIVAEFVQAPLVGPAVLLRGPKKPPSGRKPGGQPGHKKSERALLPPEKVDETLDIWPTHCESCQQPLTWVVGRRWSSLVVVVGSSVVRRRSSSVGSRSAWGTLTRLLVDLTKIADGTLCPLPPARSKRKVTVATLGFPEVSPRRVTLGADA